MSIRISVSLSEQPGQEATASIPHHIPHEMLSACAFFGGEIKVTDTIDTNMMKLEVKASNFFVNFLFFIVYSPFKILLFFPFHSILK